MPRRQGFPLLLSFCGFAPLADLTDWHGLSHLASKRLSGSLLFFHDSVSR